jgi:hypothetical protein
LNFLLGLLFEVLIFRRFIVVSKISCHRVFPRFSYLLLIVSAKISMKICFCPSPGKFTPPLDKCAHLTSVILAKIVVLLCYPWFCSFCRTQPPQKRRLPLLPLLTFGFVLKNLIYFVKKFSILPHAITFLITKL